jgi:hypothetical protein
MNSMRSASPLLSTPDLGFQFSPGVAPARETALLAALTSSLPPGADVRAARGEGSTRIAVWLRPAGEPEDGEARAAGLAGLSLLRSGESFAARVSAELIRRSVQIAWFQAPQRIDDAGRPQPDGPLHLTGFEVELQAPDRIVTVLAGRDPRHRPDLRFRLVTTDTLNAAEGAVQCASHVRLDAGDRSLNGLSGILQLSLPPSAAWFSAQSAVVPAGSDDPRITAASAGRSVTRLLPREILIAGGKKIVLDYRGLEVGPDGLRGGGSWAVAERTPAASIALPERITAEFPDLTCMAQFRLRTADLRPPFRELRWIAGGVVANPRARSTPILFDVRGARPRQVFHRQVRVQITDADGLTATAQETVAIRVTWNEFEVTRYRTDPVQMPAA